MTIATPRPPSLAPAPAAEHVSASNAASERFFATYADAVAEACQQLAARFQQGGRLLAFGAGAQQSDVAHVVVEFVHPVIVGKRALPAIGLAAPHVLGTIGHPQDILILLSGGAPTAEEHALIASARAMGMLTLALTGAANDVNADVHFAVPSSDPLVVQETHEMLYHVLWELVHVFFEHRST